MENTAFREFPVDNASILFLSLLRPYHANTFRISCTLDAPIRADLLQQAVNIIHPRFPSIVAGFRQDFFYYRQVAAEKPPVVCEDPGLMLMLSKEELRNCCFRVIYKDATISIEAFHALTDGCGGIAVLTALVSEYLRLRHPEAEGIAPLGEPQSHEVSDDYLGLAKVQPRRMPSRFAYQLPRPDDADWNVRCASISLDIGPMMEVAHRHGVTLNTLLCAVIASSIMELQIQKKGRNHLKPVRIMAPMNLRKMLDSRTLRNCSLYALPTVEGSQCDLTLQELCQLFADQLKVQLSPEFQSAIGSGNVRSQNSWYFKLMPWKLKSAALRFGYRFLGESNSSMTLTNLGVVRLPEAIRPYVTDFQCWMMPRVSSPYGCTVMTFGDKLTLNLSRFGPTDELGPVFFRNLRALLEEN